jgi:tetratricopeptide (TPR) repeat protein
MIRGKRVLLLALALAIAGCGLFNTPEKQLAEARRAMRSGDYGAAEVVLRNLLNGTDRPDARLLLARTLYMQGAAESAVHELANAVALDADPREVAELRMQWDLAAGRPDIVLQALEDEANALPEGSREYYRARALQAMRRMPEALQIYEALAAKQPDSPELQLRIAQCHAYHGRDALAQEVLGRALSMTRREGEAPVRAEALLLKAALAERARDTIGMQQAWNEAVEAAPGEFTAPMLAQLLVSGIDRALLAGDFAEARRLHERMNRALPGSPLARLFGARLRLHGDRDAGSVAADLRELLQSQPGNVAVRRVLIVALLREGAFEQALKEANVLAADNPDVPEVANLGEIVRRVIGTEEVARALALANAYVALGESALAGVSLRESLARYPGDVELRYMLARVELKVGRHDVALEIAQAIAADRPDDTGIAMLLAETQSAAGDYTSAVRTYEALWKRAPSALLAMALAQARFRAALPEVNSSLLSWLADHPDDVPVRLALASALQQGGDVEGARLHYEQVVRRAPPGSSARPVALNNLALLYAAKSHQRALETARQAYEAASDLAAVQDTYGWLLLQAGRVREALPLLELAAANTPESPEVRYHLAAALVRAGETVRARLLLEDILRTSEQFQGRAEAEQLLATL